jgi:hypothetical protein
MIWSAFEPSFAQQRLGVRATAKPFGPMTKHTVHLRTVRVSSVSQCRVSL